MSESPQFATAESVAQARTVYAGLLDDIDRLKSRVAGVRERAAEVEGKARTPEDDIRVTVGPHGELRSLEIEPRAYRKLGPSELAAEIVELCEKARRNAAEQVEKVMSSALEKDFDVEAYLRGEPQPARASRFPTPGQSLGDWLDRLKEGRL